MEISRHKQTIENDPSPIIFPNLKSPGLSFRFSVDLEEATRGGGVRPAGARTVSVSLMTQVGIFGAAKSPK